MRHWLPTIPCVLSTYAGESGLRERRPKRHNVFFFDTFWKAGLLFSNASWIAGLFILEKTFYDCKLWKIKGRARTACPGTWVATGRLQTRARQPERCAEAETSWKTSLPKTFIHTFKLFESALMRQEPPKALRTPEPPLPKRRTSDTERDLCVLLGFVFWCMP